MKASCACVSLLLAIFFVGIALADSEEILRSRIKRAPVQSSNVASVGYSRQLHALEIEFVRGAVYRFLNVPVGVYRDLLASDSKGHFIAEHLRGKYEFVRIRPKRSDSRAEERLAESRGE